MTFAFLYILLLLGYIFSYGTFNLSGLIILTFCLFFLLNYRSTKLSKKNLIIVLFFNLSLSLLVDKLLYPAFPAANLFLKSLLAVSLLLSSFYFFKSSFIKHQIIFYLLLFISFFLRIFIIYASPEPKIDAYHLLKEAPQHLLAGVNPYTTHYSKIYPQVKPDYYTYFPGSIFIFLPIVFLLDDPRWLYLAIYVMIALLTATAVKEKIKAQLFTLILFYQPLSLVIFEQGFSEILLSGLLLLIFYLAKIKKQNLGGLITGILVAVKQSMIFAVPFLLPLFLNQNKHIKKTLSLFLLVPSITIIPFIFWNFSDFWHDTIYYHLNINTIRTDLVGFSLNYLSFFYKLLHFDFTASPLYSISLVFLLYLLIFLQKQIKPLKITNSASTNILARNAALCLVIFFLGFHLLGVQAYMNYYFLISQLFLINQMFTT